MVLDLGGVAEGLATAAPAAPLCWRDDPQTSLSDWVIRVETPGATGTGTYHVHKNMLAIGIRRSEYFTRLFTGAGASGLVENVQGGSTITLEASAAEAFPAFLDFMYKGELALSDASAMALLHLASYFRNPPLHNEVAKYVQCALEGEPGSDAGVRAAQVAPLFLAEASHYTLDKAADACAGVCAKHLIACDPQYCVELEPPLYLRVVEAVKHDGLSVSQSLALSDHVAAYCNAHCQSVDLAMLEGITSMLTSVSAGSAVSLLGHALKRQGAQRLQSVCAMAIGSVWEKSLLPKVISSLASKDGGDGSGSNGSGWAPLGPTSAIPAELQFSILSHALVHASTELNDLRSRRSGAACARLPSGSWIPEAEAVRQAQLVGKREQRECALCGRVMGGLALRFHVPTHYREGHKNWIPPPGPRFS